MTTGTADKKDAEILPAAGVGAAAAAAATLKPSDADVAKAKEAKIAAAALKAKEAEFEQRVSHIIRDHVLLAAATSVIPVSFLDTAALAAVQLKLLKSLSTLYKQEFRKDLGLSAIGTLLSTVAPTVLAGGVLGSMALFSIPVIGTALRLLTQPSFNAAFTYALGKVFALHFASGGTLLTFEAEKMKKYFIDEYKHAKEMGVVSTATHA